MIALARKALGMTGGDRMFPLDGTANTSIFTTLTNNFTTTQNAHAWRSLWVHPDGHFLGVSVGADCKWAMDCHDDDRNGERQSTLVRIELTTQNRGWASWSPAAFTTLPVSTLTPQRTTDCCSPPLARTGRRA